MTHDLYVPAPAHDQHTLVEKDLKNASGNRVLTHEMTHGLTHDFDSKILPKLAVDANLVKEKMDRLCSRFFLLFPSIHLLLFCIPSRLTVYRDTAHSLTPYSTPLKTVSL